MNETKSSTAARRLLKAKVHVGCAGCSLSRDASTHFPEGDRHLARYAARLSAVESNTSFYRPHRPATYRRCAETVPADFRFSVKIPKSITHERRLNVEPEDLQAFLDEVSGLEERLGCLLVKLPPSLQFDREVVTRFFTMMRDRSPVSIVCEPRHVSWFNDEANSVLQTCGVTRVAADPAVVAGAEVPGGSLTLIYYRWHRSPRMYYSEYDDAQLSGLAENLRSAQEAGRELWCIFDNTASGAAIEKGSGSAASI